MQRMIKGLLACLVLASLAACGSFKTAIQENTKRDELFLEGFLEQAVNDMTTIHQCWLNTKAKNIDSGGCMVMATALRLTNTYLYAFLGKPDKERVPAAPEEIMQAIAEKGMNFALMRYGIKAVSNLVTSGQAASYQIALEAMRKNPIMIQPGVITTGPGGEASILQQGGASTVNP